MLGILEILDVPVGLVALCLLFRGFLISLNLVVNAVILVLSDEVFYPSMHSVIVFMLVYAHVKSDIIKIKTCMHSTKV